MQPFGGYSMFFCHTFNFLDLNLPSGHQVVFGVFWIHVINKIP